MGDKECCGNEDCHCGHNHGHEDEISMEDLVYHTDAKIDALIGLLVKKKVFSEEEYETEYRSLFKDEEEEEDEE